MKMTSLFVLTNMFVFGAPLSWALSESPSLGTLERKLLANNQQIHFLESKVKAQKATIRSQLGNFLPQISIIGGYGENQTMTETDKGYLGYVNGTWNLFKGGNDFYIKNIAKKEYEISQLELDHKNRALRRQLREIYYTILGSKKALALLAEKTSFLKQQRQMAQKKIQAGLTSSVDGVEIDLEENNIFTEQESIKAEITRLQADLKNLLNEAVEDSYVPVSDAFYTVQSKIDVKDVLANNPLLKKQERQEEISQERVSQSRSEFLPRINLEASYGKITPEYRDPLRGTESKISLLLSWNLFAGMSSYYKNQAATSEALAQGFDRKNFHLEIQKDLENLITTRNNFFVLKTYQEQKLSFAKKYYEMTLSEYKRGIKNSSDLQIATSSLFETRRKLIELDRDISITNARVNELI